MQETCRERADAEGISLIKGMEVKNVGPSMISNLITKQLGINILVLIRGQHIRGGLISMLRTTYK